MSNTVKADGADGSKTNAPKKEKKIGLVRFLQKYPQKSGIEALLKCEFASAVKTETEWKAEVDWLLSSKVK